MAGEPNRAQALEQRRAAHAWHVVTEVEDLSREVKDRFATHVKKMPTRIIASGLGQALAFLDAKGEAPQLTAALSDWLRIRRPLPAGDNLSLTERVINDSADFLRFATAESLAYLQWLGRFSEARLSQDAT